MEQINLKSGDNIGAAVSDFFYLQQFYPFRHVWTVGILMLTDIARVVFQEAGVSDIMLGMDSVEGEVVYRLSYAGASYNPLEKIDENPDVCKSVFGPILLRQLKMGSVLATYRYADNMNTLDFRQCK